MNCSFFPLVQRPATTTTTQIQNEGMLDDRMQCNRPCETGMTNGNALGGDRGKRMEGVRTKDG